MSVHPETSDFLPDAMLEEMHADQKRVLAAWGVSIPDDEEMSETPLSVRVRLFDFMIQEAMEAQFV